MASPPPVERFFMYEPGESYSRPWLRDLLDRIGSALQGIVRTSEAAPHVLLLSPSAKVFRVTVSDTGVLTATEVPQGDASQ